MQLVISFDLVKILVSALLFALSFLTTNSISLGLLIMSYIVVSYKIYYESFKALKNKEIFNEFSLMIIATLGAFFIGEYSEAVAVMLLYSFGEYLSDLAVERSKSSLIKVMNLRVDTVHLLKNKKTQDIKVEDVEVGDIFQISPGERIPLDGEIIEGTSFIDTSSITGESVPKKVGIGDSILSGCINNESVLTIKSTSTSKTTTTTKILELIEDSAKAQSKTEKFITKFSRIYTPVIVFCALIIIIVSSLITQQFDQWLYRGLVFLVTACPCALVISVPLGYFCGIGKCSKCGAVIKGSNVLDNLTNIDYLLLDKTGTITEGVFEINEVKNIGISKEEFLKIVASAEQFSIHPIAKAIKNSYNDKLLKVDDYKEISGEGICCKISNKQVYIGNKKLLSEHNIECIEVNNPNTIIHLAIEDKYVGYIIISDKIKDNNKDLSNLKTAIKKDIIILSGDNIGIVENVSKTVNIKTFFGELSPLSKVSKIKEYNNIGTTMFVGDGVNDALALTNANVGVSIGNIGSDAAIEASDVVLMNDNLNVIAKIIQISKLTKRKVTQAITFALSVKMIILVLSIFGLSSIWLAVFADVGVTLLSVLYVLTISCKKI